MMRQLVSTNRIALEIAHRFYLMGYKGVCLPREFRRRIAQSDCHRAWLSGHMGIYFMDDQKTSVCDREAWQFRKGPLRPVEPGMLEIVRRLIQPHSY